MDKILDLHDQLIELGASVALEFSDYVSPLSVVTYSIPVIGHVIVDKEFIIESSRFSSLPMLYTLLDHSLTFFSTNPVEPTF